MGPIILCYPPIGGAYDSTRDIGLAPPLGLLTIAAYLQAHDQALHIEIMDGNHRSMTEIGARITSLNPALVGFSVDFTNYQPAIALCTIAQRTGARTILGSNHASFLSRQILKHQPAVDGVGLNDGEVTVAAYLQALTLDTPLDTVPNLAYRDGDGLVRESPTQLLDAGALPAPAYDLVDMDAYFRRQRAVFGSGFRMMQFYSQKGCANSPHCVFCGRFTDPVRYRDPIVYASEVRRYIDRYDLTEVWDRSDSFLQNTGWLRRVRDAFLADGGIGNPFTSRAVSYKTYARADQVLDDAVLDILDDLNFRMVFIGYEAGDDRILRNIRKNATTTLYRTATRNLLDRGIDIDASFIVGLPGENNASLRNHIRFVKDLVEIGLRKIRVNRVLVLPGTPLYHAVLEANPELGMRDAVPMPVLQRRLFQTDRYDLSGFGHDLDAFIDALDATARKMCDIVLDAGGAAEGYGHGAGKTIMKGNEVSLS